MTGHFKKANVAPVKVLREVRLPESKDETKVGDRVLVENFKAGELVDVSGVSKGRGFAGGVKRWHYAGGDATHGSMFHRAPGGIGGSSFPSRVWKNQHFPGHMGNAARHREEFESDQGGHGREPVAGSRFGARAEWNVHFHPQGQESCEEVQVGQPTVIGRSSTAKEVKQMAVGEQPKAGVSKEDQERAKICQS